MKFALVILLLPANLFGQIILSEVLSNEPLGRVSLEWVEIANTSDFYVDLVDFGFVCDEDTTRFPDGSRLGGHEFAILARQLVSSGGDSFEGHWGDSSGFWGDAPTETFDAYQANMNLVNIAGSVCIIDAYGAVVDSFVWDSASQDGVSMERDNVEDPASGWHGCSDASGSTPGAPNSAPRPNQLFEFNISPMLFSYSRGPASFRIDISIPYVSSAKIEIYDDAGRRRWEFFENSSIWLKTIYWDGTDDRGNKVPPGIYFVMLSVTGNLHVDDSIPVVIAP